MSSIATLTGSYQSLRGITGSSSNWSGRRSYARSEDDGIVADIPSYDACRIAAQRFME